jgi:hypothetical protein
MEKIWYTATMEVVTLRANFSSHLFFHSLTDQEGSWNKDLSKKNNCGNECVLTGAQQPEIPKLSKLSFVSNGSFHDNNYNGCLRF